MNVLEYRHVDVFSAIPLSGNGLTVFWNGEHLPSKTMQKIADEMKQFESIFLFPASDTHCLKARIFTVEEELDFAGHPILGAACAAHEKISKNAKMAEWIFELPQKIVSVKTIKKEKSYFAAMEQGSPHFEEPLAHSLHEIFLSTFHLTKEDLHPSLPLQVVSTGLPYLIIPLQKGLDNARITTDRLEEMLSKIGAKFCYLVDVPNLEGRNWDNLGRVEDVATGSAAGPVGAYLVRHGFIEPNKEFILHQGRFTGRPSQIFVTIKGTKEKIDAITVGGDVCMVARGIFDDLSFP